MSAGSVNGKTAIVTGGGSGIGLSFVQKLQAKGCNVVIADLRLTSEAEKFMKEIEGKKAKVLFKATDVTSWKQLNDMFEFTEKEIGSPDIVCPGAGLFEPKWSHFWNDTETEDGYKTVDVNINHPVKATRLAIRSFLKANKPGTVVHISSIAGQTTRLSVPIYCASKAFVNHFIRAFEGIEEREGIRVLGVAPGMVRTPLWFDANPEKLKSVGQTDHWIEASEIADVLIDLCENPKYKSGQIIEASGQGRTRSIAVFNDAGPPGIGGTAGANMELEEEIYTMMKQERSGLKSKL